MSMYLAWRCADTKGRSPVASDRPQKIAVAWHQGTCSWCGEAVWYQHKHLASHTLVCWPCSQSAEAAA